MRDTPLIFIRVQSNGSAEYLPKLDEYPSKPEFVQFDSWWNGIVLKDNDFRLSRKSLIFSLRNQDGGSHFDSELRNPNYVQFSQAQQTTPFVWSTGKPSAPVLGAELATMRQIAWEVMLTLEQQGPIQ